MSNLSARKSDKDQDNNSASMQSTDPFPLDPRPSNTTGHAPETREQIQQEHPLNPQEQILTEPPPYLEQEDDLEDGFLDIPRPHADWKFNCFLVDLADKINDKEELEKLKQLFRGDIGEGVLSAIATPSELFKILRQRTHINRENLLYLQSILMKLKRPKLIQMAIDYAKTIGNVIHFSPASDEPLNGYKYIQFHVEGLRKNCTRKNIKNLRQIVSDLLFIPLEYVIIAGVEPSSSMLITLMIPDMYAEILENMLKAKDNLVELTDMGIDTIAVLGNIYNIYGVEEVEIVETEQQAKFVNVYKQLQDKTKQLEAREIECIHFSREIDTLKSKSSEEPSVEVLKTLFYNVSVEDGDTANKKIPASLSSQSAFTEFTKELQVVSKLGYDKKVIRHLLSTNSAIVRNRTRDTQMIQLRKMQLAVEDLQSSIIPIKHELAKCQFYLEIETTGFLEQFIQTLLDGFLHSITSVTETWELTEDAMTTLKKISRQLRGKERQTLEQKYVWDPKDRLTQAKNEYRDLLLACIVVKEAQKCGPAALNFVQFVSNCLTEVGRADLNKKFQEIIVKKSKSQSKSKERQRQAIPQSDQNVDFRMMADQINSIDLNVTAIYDAIDSSKKSYNHSVDNPWKGSCEPSWFPEKMPSSFRFPRTMTS